MYYISWETGSSSLMLVKLVSILYILYLIHNPGFLRSYLRSPCPGTSDPSIKDKHEDSRETGKKSSGGLYVVWGTHGDWRSKGNPSRFRDGLVPFSLSLQVPNDGTEGRILWDRPTWGGGLGDEDGRGEGRPSFRRHGGSGTPRGWRTGVEIVIREIVWEEFNGLNSHGRRRTVLELTYVWTRDCCYVNLILDHCFPILISLW